MDSRKLLRFTLKYLPDFITHHLKLVDKIWFIDHCSENSLDRFSSNKIKVFKFPYKAQFQGEVVTLIARNIKNRHKKGWLFILDILAKLTHMKSNKRLLML